MFQQAYAIDEFADILDANENAPDWLSDDEVVERIVQYAKSRAEANGADSAYDDSGNLCIITTDWSGFVEDWGFSGGSQNQVAIGEFNEERSSGKNADQFRNTEILQTEWLRDGDGRLTQAEMYEEDPDGGYEPDVGEMWVPNGAQDYICIKGLSGELLHGEPTLADAM